MTMSNMQGRTAVHSELDRLTLEFFQSVSFSPGSKPNYEHIHELFVEQGLLIKNVTPTPEISTVSQFIAPRHESVRAGDLTHFHESELSETTVVFGNVAHRFSAYTKSGTLKGTPFTARGMISTQFIHTPKGWRVSSMAWDDERPGLQLPADSAQPATHPPGP
jgi:hypothetical protein